MNNSTVVYIHGKGGSAGEAEAYRALFPGEVIGFDYRAQTPWEARQEFPAFFDSLRAAGGPPILIANSIGAYFAMQSLAGRPIRKAFLISPIVDMERLILAMLRQTGMTEAALRNNGELRTDSGEVLSWDYLCDARQNPCFWEVPTHILYGEKDFLTSYDTIVAFSRRIGAELTVMKDGEHWFHTEEQMAFLFSWMRRAL